MKQRNIGIDILRIVAMFFVVIIHMLVQGGVISAFLNEGLQVGYYFFNTIGILACCGVNCFALVSGYVGWQNTFRLEKIIKLWATVVFWSVGVSLILFIYKNEFFSLKEAISMFLPLIRGRYWFFNAYFVVFMFSPVLNHIIKTLPQKTYQYFLLAVAFVFCVIPFLALGNDVLRIQSGYEFPWLMVMYLVGGYFSKYPIVIKKPYKCVVAFFSISLLNFIYKYLIELVTTRLLGAPSYGDIFMSYTSPVLVGEAICLLLFFSNLQVKNKKLVKAVSFVTPAIFSVYIIHVHPLVFWNILKDSFTGLTEYNFLVSFVLIIAIVLAIFMGCIALDYLRIFIFKLLRINTLCDKIGKNIKNWIESWCENVNNKKKRNRT